MNIKLKLTEQITKQLDEQEILYEFLTERELKELETKWKKKFIEEKKKPHSNQYNTQYKWHIFSFDTDSIKGKQATNEYKKQHPADIYIFNEELQYGLKCAKAEQLPNILMEGFSDDIYICHHNMKWTYVIPHEAPHIGSFFSN
ncbi:MAG: DUF4275 family protein [Daejeonella sp.]